MEKAYLCVLPQNSLKVSARRYPARQLRSMFCRRVIDAEFQQWLDMCESMGEPGETFYHDDGEYVVILVGTW